MTARPIKRLLSKRYGPVISARFITANLLRVLGSCYTGMALLGSNQEPESVFTLSLVGDECGARVEACLSEIAATYSVTFVTAVSLLYNISMRIGLENTRMYARKPFELMFETFGKLYEADEQLKISPKKLDPAE
ncbi:hypothetical protein ANCDUO_19848, partial [Ancylostoma duodenale]